MKPKPKPTAKGRSKTQNKQEKKKHDKREEEDEPPHDPDHEPLGGEDDEDEDDNDYGFGLDGMDELLGGGKKDEPVKKRPASTRLVSDGQTTSNFLCLPKHIQ